MAKVSLETIIKQLGKISGQLAEIIPKRGWFKKEEKVLLENALSMLNSVLANKIKERNNWRD